MSQRTIETDDGNVEVEEIRLEDVRAFLSHARALARLVARMRCYSPHAQLYMQEDSLHLMIGPSHVSGGWNEKPVREHSIESVHIPFSGGGGW